MSKVEFGACVCMPYPFTYVRPFNMPHIARLSCHFHVEKIIVRILLGDMVMPQRMAPVASERWLSDCHLQVRLVCSYAHTFVLLFEKGESGKISKNFSTLITKKPWISVALEFCTQELINIARHMRVAYVALSFSGFWWIFFLFWLREYQEPNIQLFHFNFVSAVRT